MGPDVAAERAPAPPVGMQGGRVVDDRGRPVRVLDPAGFFAWPIETDPRVRDLLGRVGVAMQRSSARWTVWVVAGGVMCTAMVFSWRLYVLVPAVPRIVWFLGCTIAASVAVQGVMRFAMRQAAKDAAVLILEEGLCPTCGYNYNELPVEPDGCYVCPECGGAWRADRVRRAAPFVGEGGTSVLQTIRGAARNTSRPITTDDRGRGVALVHPRMRRERREAADEAHRARIDAARRRVARIGRAVRWIVGGFLIALGIAVLCIVVLSVAPMPTMGRVGVLFGAMCMAGLGVAAILGNFGCRVKPIIEAVRSEGLCPSCAALLEGREPEEDGCTVCPACLSAWRMRR